MRGWAQSSKDNFLRLCLPIFTVADEKSESSLLFSFVSSFLISQETYMIFSLSLEVSTLLAYALGCICLFAIISTGTWWPSSIHIWPLRAFSGWPCVPLTCPILYGFLSFFFFWALPFLLACQDAPGSSCIFAAPALESVISHFSKEPWFVCLFLILFIYLFIYGCVGSSFLCEGFL